MQRAFIRSNVGWFVSKTKGLVAAVLAYTAWGPLAPLGLLLLGHTGPFTLNTVRTAGALLLFLIVWGPRLVVRCFRLMGRDHRLWILGVVGLGFTFGAYLTSLKYLEPTIAALTIYLAPIFITWYAQRRLGEKGSPWTIPVVVLTLVGGAIAVLEPSRGASLPRGEAWGLFLGLLGVLGWCFYTIYLKHLGGAYTDQELTLSGFLTSGAAFLALAIPLERLAFDVNQASLLQMAFYIVFPSFVSFQLYSVAVRNAGASLTSILLGIELAATAVFSYFLTGEQFSADKIVGIGIVLAAVTGFLVLESRRAPEPPALETAG